MGVTKPVEPRLNAYSVRRENGCIDWTRAKGRFGYGVIRVSGKIREAYRVAYEFYRGPVPTGLVLDHLCRNPACINPDHLETVTQAENIRRGMLPNNLIHKSGRCSHGHEMSGGNLHVSPKGVRVCRACSRAASIRYLERKRNVT